MDIHTHTHTSLALIRGDAKSCTQCASLGTSAKREFEAERERESRGLLIIEGSLRQATLQNWVEQACLCQLQRV